MTENFIIRPATKENRLKIRGLVCRVAEIKREIVGVRQIKIHNDGTQEVASGVVISKYRHRGISKLLMAELLKGEAEPLYLMCDEKWAHYYKQFGFERESIGGLPPSLIRQYKILKAIYSVASKVILGDKFQLTPMKRLQL